MMKQINKIILVLCAVMQVANAPAQTVSSATMEFKYCLPSMGADTFGAVAFPAQWKDFVIQHPGDTALLLVNANVRHCDSVVNLHARTIEIGAVYPFSVSAEKKVYFSPGNLQFLASKDGTGSDLTHEVQGVYEHTTPNNKGWLRFAPHQWDVVDWSKVDQKAWIGNWGKSTSWEDELYYWSFYQYPQCHKINGDNHDYQWSMLWGSEWDYLLGVGTSSRPNAANLHCYATVNQVNGLVILPDAWKQPTGIQPITYGEKDYASNVFDADEWALMEGAGAVFLPAIGLCCYCTNWNGFKCPITTGTYGTYYCGLMQASTSYYTYDTNLYGWFEFSPSLLQYIGAFKVANSTVSMSCYDSNRVSYKTAVPVRLVRVVL